MTIVMLDSVQPNLIPKTSPAVALYDDGTFEESRALFPHAQILMISVFARDDGDCLDVETGDAIPSQAPAWVKRQKTSRPCLYASASVMPVIRSFLSQAGIPRSSVRLWSAHYTDRPHICGPASCGEISFPVDGTQWTDHYQGKNIDASLLSDDFFATSATQGTGTPVTVFLTSAQTGQIMSQLPVLSPGMSDGDFPHLYITRVQAVLNAVWHQGLVIDGAYGPATQTAVKTIQERNHLSPDGITGPATWALIVAGGQ
jgi:hypothetical protein